MTSTITTKASDIVIKQYHITGRCVVRSGGQFGTVNGATVTELNNAVQKATIPLDNVQDQRAAVDDVMSDYGYKLERFDRDDYRNTLLTYAVAK